MEVEAAFSSCSPDSVAETAMEEEPSSENPHSSAAGDGAANPCFDCNICLSFAADPVVTLCGHLYCWPCIYRWLHPTPTGDGRSQCPVCKSPFSESSLIPLYGSGLDAESHHRTQGIPDRPKHHRKLLAPAAADRRRQIYPFYGDGQGGSILFTGPGGSRGRRRRRRSMQELRAESFLHQLWGFLFCCAVLCFVFF